MPSANRPSTVAQAPSACPPPPRLAARRWACPDPRRRRRRRRRWVRSGRRVPHERPSRHAPPPSALLQVHDQPRAGAPLDRRPPVGRLRPLLVADPPSQGGRLGELLCPRLGSDDPLEDVGVRQLQSRLQEPPRRADAVAVVDAAIGKDIFRSWPRQQERVPSWPGSCAASILHQFQPRSQIQVRRRLRAVDLCVDLLGEAATVLEDQGVIREAEPQVDVLRADLVSGREVN